MTRARRELVSLDSTPYYHVISRCVRRAFLCGEDTFSGKSYEHRKSWVVARLHELNDIFAIDICAYAVMSNHYHLVLRLDTEQATEWSEEEVVVRWEKLFKRPLILSRYLRGEARTVAERKAAQELIAQWRGRLVDLSWYMRCLNEYLARRANEEDSCTGRFWEGRFKSQALLDEAAVLTCMSYVDLNPIRAGIASLPEESDFTSIQQRIRKLGDEAPPEKNTPSIKLMPLVRQHRDRHRHAIGFTSRDYLELVDWAGRAIREDERGAIAQSAPPILVRLGIDPVTYAHHVKDAKHAEMAVAIGKVHHIKLAAIALGRKFLKGQKAARLLYGL